MFSDIHPESVFLYLSNLNIWKAQGNDGLNHRLLKSCASSLSDPLCHVYNLSLRSGIFPSRWKTALIQPIFKCKGERSDPKNYRPIALLPCVSKVFEHFVHQQLLKFCLAHRTIPDAQFGFLPKRSTVWQLLDVLEDIHLALEEGSLVHACFLDISKAFDRVDHGLLLRKLQAIGIAKKELSWFSTYLRHRNISTCVDGVCSRELAISSGVPQGSVLGPLLFIIYLSDLPAVVTGTPALFADDTLVYDRCSGKNAPSCCRLQQDLESIHEWSDEWSTTFNAGKSAVMAFRGKRKPAESTDRSTLTLGTSQVPSCEQVKHLGIRLTSTLSWSPHIDSLLHRIAHRVYILKCLARRCDRNGFVSHLYLALVRPVLEYGGPVWDSCTRHDSLRLERVQLSVARAIMRMDRKTFSNVSVLESIGWSSLAWRRRRFKLLLLWKLLHGEGPPSLRKKVPPPVESRSSMSLRRSTLRQVVCHTERRLRSFLPSTVALWNTLPVSVTSCSSCSDFLSALDSFFASDKYSFGLV